MNKIKWIAIVKEVSESDSKGKGQFATSKEPTIRKSIVTHTWYINAEHSDSIKVLTTLRQSK